MQGLLEGDPGRALDQRAGEPVPGIAVGEELPRADRSGKGLVLRQPLEGVLAVAVLIERLRPVTGEA